MRLRVVCLLMSIAAALPAARCCRAGAFMLEPGTGQFIAGVGYTEGSRRFDASGTPVPAPTSSKADASGYFEYGVTPDFDIVIAPTLAHEHDGGASNTITGSSSSAFGGRLALVQMRDAVVAVQVLVQPPLGEESLAEALADGGARAFAIDARLMAAKSFSCLGLPMFVDIDPGIRLRADPFPTEARVDATVGARLQSRLLLLVQDFSSFASSSGPLIPRTSWSKLQASLVYDLSPRWSLQFGALRTLEGRNTVRETGPLFGLWTRF